LQRKYRFLFFAKDHLRYQLQCQREMYIRLALGELLMMSSVSGQRSP
jgi:hypothetical protein